MWYYHLWYHIKQVNTEQNTNIKEHKENHIKQKVVCPAGCVFVGLDFRLRATKRPNPSTLPLQRPAKGHNPSLASHPQT